jgi:hypothetical protein
VPADPVEGGRRPAPSRGRRRGSFASPVELQASINRYLEANVDPRPFVRTAEPDGIIEKVRRGYQASRSSRCGDRLTHRPLSASRLPGTRKVDEPFDNRLVVITTSPGAHDIDGEHMLSVSDG